MNGSKEMESKASKKTGIDLRLGIISDHYSKRYRVILFPSEGRR